jgi:hypothetical protein
VRGSDWASIEVVNAAGVTERYVRPPAPSLQRPLPIPETHVRLRYAGAARALESTKKVVRVLVRAIYLFPLLLVVKLGLFLGNSPLGDYLTVAFVLLVCATFGLLSLMALLHVFAGPRTQRSEKRTVELALPDATAALAVLDRAQPSSTEELLRLTQAAGSDALRVRGRIDAGGSTVAGEVVLAERWLEHGTDVLRVVEGRSFAVVPDEGPVVVVELAASPRLLGPYAPSDAATPGDRSEKLLAELALPPTKGVIHGCDLRQGDEVELVADQAESVAGVSEAAGRDLQLQRAASGVYRAETERVLKVLAGETVSLLRRG